MEILNNNHIFFTSIKQQYNIIIKQLNLFFLYLTIKQIKNKTQFFNFIKPIHSNIYTNQPQHITNNKSTYIPITNTTTYIQDGVQYKTAGCILQLNITRKQAQELNKLLVTGEREHYTFTPKNQPSYFLHHYTKNTPLTNIQQLQIPQHTYLVCCFGAYHPMSNKHIFPNNAPIGVEIVELDQAGVTTRVAQFYAMEVM